jgi:phage gp36-like protein
VTQQAYATLRDLDELGLGQATLAKVPPAHKKRGILAASGRIAAYLRKKHTLPFRPDIDGIDDSGMTLGAVATFLGTATLVQDVSILFTAAGTIGTDPLTYQLSTEAGKLYGTTQNLASSGAIVIDNVTVTFAGDVAVNDVFTYSTRVDLGLCESTVAIAVYILLTNRGVDPASFEDMETRWKKALEWAKDHSVGDAELDGASDNSPTVDEGGVLFESEADPYAWADTQRFNVRGG